MTGHPPHTFACYGPEQLPCPGCGVPVIQQRLQCGLDMVPSAECIACSLRCPDCPAEVRVTEGATLFRARVIHSGTCPWYRRFLAKEVAGRVPCATTVTHRGPYKRDPEARA
jgi:hypothetical protein